LEVSIVCSTTQISIYAYARLLQNKGAMTQGATAETVDAMSLAKIEGSLTTSV